MFTKDTRTETFLTQMGAEYYYLKRALFTELCPKWRETNLSRPVPIRDDAVIQYASLMGNNSPAPAPILHKGEAGYAILDGVQRVAAAELGAYSEISGYVVTSDSPDLLLAISMLANVRLQGHAEPPEWTKRRAVEVLVIERKMSIDEVARMGAWRKSEIQVLAEVLGWQATVREIGGPELADTMVSIVGQQLSKSELRASGAPAAQFLEILKTAKFSANDATPHIEEFFRPVSKSGKRFQVLSERLEAFKADPEVQVRIHGRKGSALPADVNLRRAMQSVITVLDNIQKSGDKLLYVDEFFGLADDIHRGLHVLAPSRKKSATARVPSDLWSKDVK